MDVVIPYGKRSGFGIGDHELVFAAGVDRVRSDLESTLCVRVCLRRLVPLFGGWSGRKPKRKKTRLFGPFGFPGLTPTNQDKSSLGPCACFCLLRAQAATGSSKSAGRRLDVVLPRVCRTIKSRRCRSNPYTLFLAGPPTSIEQQVNIHTCCPPKGSKQVLFFATLWPGLTQGPPRACGGSGRT